MDNKDGWTRRVHVAFEEDLDQYPTLALRFPAIHNSRSRESKALLDFSEHQTNRWPVLLTCVCVGVCAHTHAHMHAHACAPACACVLSRWQTAPSAAVPKWRCELSPAQEEPLDRYKTHSISQNIKWKHNLENPLIEEKQLHFSGKGSVMVETVWVHEKEAWGSVWTNGRCKRRRSVVREKALKAFPRD